MNAESEMAGADGLGAEGLDPCAQIAESVGYHAEGEGSMEVLIAYKDALEDAVRRVASLPSPKHVEPTECTTCGMFLGEEQPEFHPHALCLLVEARKGDTNAARRDLAFVIGAARAQESPLRALVDRFMRQVSRRV